LIKEEDLLEAIAECQGERNPDSKTCIKLAAFYTILNNMYSHSELPQYSRSESSEQVRYDSGSEFSDAICGIDLNDALSIIDELMDAVQLISPKLYNATIERLKRL